MPRWYPAFETNSSGVMGAVPRDHLDCGEVTSDKRDCVTQCTIVQTPR